MNEPNACFHRRSFVVLLTTLFLSLVTNVSAQSDTWSGNTSAVWNEAGNWVGGGIPGTGNTATFLDGGNSNTTIDLGAGVTISVIQFNAGAASYTIGSGGVNAQTLTIDDSGDINLAAGVTANQTVNASIILGDGTGNNSIILDNDSGSTLLLAGNITSGIGTAQQTLRAQGTGLIELAGTMTAGGSRLTLESRGNLVVSGNVVGTGNTQRTIVRNGGVLTTSATGLIGQGNLDLRNGTVNLNNATNIQLFDDGITLGDTTLGDGNATINIGSGVTIELDSNVTYQADDDTANLASINGGTIDLSDANRTFTIQDNALVSGNVGDVELTLSTNIMGSGNTNGTAEDLTFIGDGALFWDSTIDQSDPNQMVDLVTFSNQKTIIGATGANMTGVRRSFRIAQRNNAAFSDFDIEFDVNGQTLLLDDDLILGVFNNNNIAPANLSNIRVTDSVGGGLIRLTNDNDITYFHGNPDANLDGTNKQAFIEVDIVAEDNTMTLDIRNGQDDVDLEISGTITGDIAGRDIAKTGRGTLRLTATDNAYRFLNVQRGTLQIDQSGALGTNDINLGNNNFAGTFEYVGAGETIGNQFRIGDNDNGTGGGVVLHNGTGELVLSVGTFNQARTAATAARTLTLGGNSSSNATINGAIGDNNLAGGNTANVALIKEGTGTWILDGDNTYTGNTNVNVGRLDVNGTNTGNGDFTVAANASLGGEGSIAGNLTFGGNNTLFINPETSGSFTTSGALVVSSGNVTVDFSGKTGSGNISVLTFGTYANSANVANEFVAAAGTMTSGRGGGSLTASISGSSVVFDLGFQTRTWVGGATADQMRWEDEGTNANNFNNWQEGDQDFYNGDSVVFDGTVAVTQTINLTSNVSPGSVTFQNHTSAFTISSNTTETLEFAGGMNFFGDNATADDRIEALLTGNGTITKGQTTAGASDTGTAIFTGNNTSFGGVTVVNQGNVQINNVNALGANASNSITLNDFGDDGQFIINTQGTVVNNIIATNQGNNKQIRFDNGGNTAARAATLTGAITTEETSSSLVFSVEGQTENADYGGTTSGAVARNTHVLTVDSLISSASPAADGAIVKADFGTAIFTNGANDYTGGTFVNAGTLYVASIGNIGQASHAGATRSNVTRHFRLGQNNNDGTLVYTGSGNTTDRVVQVGARNGTGNNNTGGARIVNNGTGALVFTNATFNLEEANRPNADTGARTLTLAGQYTGTNVIEGVIKDNTPNDTFVDEFVSIDIDTDGTWQLNGANTYTGNTTVTSGTLRVNGSTTTASTVSVAANGTLAGSGTIGGNTSFASGATHTGGDTTTAAAQTLSNDVSYATGSTVSWNLVSNSTTVGQYDQFTVGGSLSFGTSMTNDLNLEISFGDNVNLDDTFWNNGANTNEWEIWDYATLASTFGDTDFNISLSGDSTGAGLGFFSASAFEIANSNFANDNAGIWLRQIAPIPEPSTYALMSLGLAGFGWFVRRRKKKAAAASEE